MDPAWHWDAAKTVTLEVMPTDQPDTGDLAMALPFALRRAGLVRHLLPGVTGRPRVFAREGEPLELLAKWLTGLERQVEESAARLRLPERHITIVEAGLAEVRRPAALRRLVAASLGAWGVWAAQLARLTGVEVSSAWRTLDQAAEIGLVSPVPTVRRSRSDAQLYAAAPWLRMAGLISGQRGMPNNTQPALSLPRDRLCDAIAEVDDALASFDTLLRH